MPRATQGLTVWVETHPRGGAVVVGLVAGLLAFLLGLLIFRRPVWNLFVIAALAAGGATYFNALFREQDRERSQSRPRPRLVPFGRAVLLAKDITWPRG